MVYKGDVAHSRIKRAKFKVEKDSVLAGFRMNSYRIYKETVDRLRISISSYRMRNSISESYFDETNITDFLS